MNHELRKTKVYAIEADENGILKYMNKRYQAISIDEIPKEDLACEHCDLHIVNPTGMPSLCDAPEVECFHVAYVGGGCVFKEIVEKDNG